MSDCECDDCPPCGGAPEWVMTFADLMSLLMVFFVLLLSFSEMDVQKYKQVAGSMKAAFGVQREIKVSDMPTGTSIIAQEFSPAQPESTLTNEVRQQTTDELKSYLKVDDSGAGTSDAQEQEQDAGAADAEEKAEELREALKEEIAKGLLEISTIDDQVVMRIREQGSFASASAKISPAFANVMLKISDALDQVAGKILVSGHTDNIPIQTFEFPSNWTLSSARAAAVATAMTSKGIVAEDRVEIRAYGENHPIEPNSAAEGRAANRRVEIIVLGEKSAQRLLGDPNEQATTAQPQRTTK